MNVVAVVQARAGSSRLPAKIFLDLGGATALERCLRRVARIEGVSEVVVATTVDPVDDLVVALAHRLGFASTRGSTDDVLSRYVEAARGHGADAVVRCTSDCPLLDPALSSLVVRQFLASHQTAEPLDYAANNLERRLPRGLDTEIATLSALERAHREATSAAEREHVTLRLYRRPEDYRVRAVVVDPTSDLSHHRWTLDTLDDYRFLSAVYDALGARAAEATMQDVLTILQANPAIVALNAHIEQKPVP